MTITKVKYEKLFPTGAYLNEKIGFEAEIVSVPASSTPEDVIEWHNLGITPQRIESPLEVVESLRKLAEQSHKEKYPHLYTESGSPVTFSEPEVPIIPKNNSEAKQNTVDKMIADINSCKELKVLESYKLIAKSNPAFQEAYDNKLKEFQ
jgi:hypothetical protein